MHSIFGERERANWGRVENSNVIVASRPGIPRIGPEMVSVSRCPWNSEFFPGFLVSRGAPSALDIFLYFVAR